MYAGADPAISNLAGVRSMTHVRSKERRQSIKIGGSQDHLIYPIRICEHINSSQLIGFEITIRARREKSTFFAP